MAEFTDYKSAAKHQLQEWAAAAKPKPKDQKQ
jgi:hypothetical protein